MSGDVAQLCPRRMPSKIGDRARALYPAERPAFQRSGVSSSNTKMDIHGDIAQLVRARH